MTIWPRDWPGQIRVRRKYEKGSTGSFSLCLTDQRSDQTRPKAQGDMKTTSERLGNGLAKMTVEVSPEEVQEEYVRAAARISNRAKIPGFRPGKAPRALIERMFGEKAILGGAVEHLVAQAGYGSGA